MNILPKKRWHVRTKDNIARVRRDEAKAAEEEKERERRAKLAEQEARTALLRQRARTAEETSGLPKIDFIGSGKSEDKAAENSTTENSDDLSSNKNLDAFSSQINKPCADIFTESGNINFFKDLETGVGSTNSLTNKDHEAEERAEKEKYEKQIGLLTYLGQDTLEATKSKEWYHDSSRCISSLWTGKDTNDLDTTTQGSENGTDIMEVGLKYKGAHDPLNDMIKYVGWKRTKSSSVVGEAAVAKSSQASFTSTNNESSSPPSPKKEKKLKKLLKKRQKLDKKILGYSSSTSKKSKKYKSSDYSRESKKRKRSERDNEGRCRKRNKSAHSSKTKKSKRSKSWKTKSSKSRSDDSSSSDSGSESCYTTDSEAERKEREEQRLKLAKLREERLAREAVEQQRQKRLLAGQKPDEAPRPSGGEVVTQKYSSQFNPLLARQNRGLQSGVKYF
ncbi:CBF1-interacting co-repressor CIR N-terminal domain [Trinorchestia longiramus]|nr:CBF1-interacting co-repressor CIR N-terminal domain [Trinorchestia longiramus]